MLPTFHTDLMCFHIIMNCRSQASALSHTVVRVGCDWKNSQTLSYSTIKLVTKTTQTSWKVLICFRIVFQVNGKINRFLWQS